MLILILFAFLAGIVTILSPCILPVLPIILSGSVSGSKARPLRIIVGFILSFTFFTLFLTTIVRATGIPVDALRILAIIIIALFGITMLANIELFKVSFIPKTSNGFLLGASLGLVWAPCVGPILASVIALALTGTVNGISILITLSYAIGTAIPMLVILYGGRKYIPSSPKVQRTFGVVMIVVAFAMFVNLDRKFQTWVLTVFPNYGVGLTKIETVPLVSDALKGLKTTPVATNGTPMNEVLESNMNMAPELIGGQQWFNSEPLTLKELKGRVVLIDFWTYTCINCIRTLPYTEAWYERYKDKGFVLIGVHTPEFEFEKDAGNVAKAIKDFGLTYPVVQDNDYAIWNAYDNHYWPAHYLIDKSGKIVDTHFGEGAYDETEKKIQELLSVSMPVDNPSYQIQTRSPETYLGLARMDGLASPETPQLNALMKFTSPSPVPYNTFAFEGSWTINTERALPQAGASLFYHFDAMNVFLVMRPKSQGLPGKIQVLLDGKASTTLTVDSDRLYDIVKLPAQGEHVVELKFLDGNLELYAFTFG